MFYLVRALEDNDEHCWYREPVAAVVKAISTNEAINIFDGLTDGHHRKYTTKNTEVIPLDETTEYGLILQAVVPE